jgi:uroporphyrinogen-III synthase
MSARVLVTRSPDQAAPLAAALRREGLEPVVVPAIAVELDPPGGPLDAVARRLPTFEWVVVTSPNGAAAVLAAAERARADPSAASWAAIGDSTAGILERAEIAVDFQPSRADARTLAAELPVRNGQQVLLVRGDLAGDELPDRLRNRGATVTDAIAYHTVEAPASSRSLLREAFGAGRPDVVILASGSAVRGLAALAATERLDVGSIPAICIGPETAREAAQLGFRVVATSATRDATSLAATAAAALAQPLETR